MVKLSALTMVAYDVDGDSLAYSLAQPLDAAGVPIAYTAGYSITNPVTEHWWI